MIFEGMIMDGDSMNVGSVATMKLIASPIHVALDVLEHTDVSIIGGEGATAFGEAMGYKREDLHSTESIQEHREWRERNCQPNYWVDVTPDSRSHCGPYVKREEFLVAGSSAVESSGSDMIARSMKEKAIENRHSISYENHDTIGMVTVDSRGKLAGAY